jgi:hypothetical protein
MADYTLHPDDDKFDFCPRCRVLLRPLARFKPEDVRFISDVEPNAELMTRALGWRYFAGTFLLTFLETLYEFGASAWRARKVARLKRRHLAEHPKSQICPRCFYVKPQR